MKLIVNWWRNKWLNHIQQTIIHKNVKIKAQYEGQIPQLTITWVIENCSETKVTITGISGDLYVGAWRLGTFNSFPLIIKQFGTVWSPLVTIRQNVIKKGDISEVEVIFFPPTELWLTDNKTCSIYNTGVEISSFWGKVTNRIPEGSENIENIEAVANSYKNKFGNKLKSILELR